MLKPFSRSSSHRCHLADNDAHVWIIDTREISQEQASQHAQRGLANEEIQRLRTMRSASRRHQYAIARLALRSLLTCYLPGNTPRDFTFAVSEHGKPRLNDNAWGLHFNLSHSGDKILIGFARHRQIGVDIELISGKRNYQRIGDEYFHPFEWNAEVLNQKSEAGVDAATYFYSLWTLKEAVLKATGKGLSLPIDSFYFSVADTPRLHWVSDPGEGTGGQWQCYSATVDGHYAMAVAAEQGRAHQPLNVHTRVYLPL